jgi:hypothetical protein
MKSPSFLAEEKKIYFPADGLKELFALILLVVTSAPCSKLSVSRGLELQNQAMMSAIGDFWKPMPPFSPL